MKMGNTILDTVNDVSRVATGETLERFDTNGSPIIREEVKLTSKKKIARNIRRLFKVLFEKGRGTHSTRRQKNKLVKQELLLVVIARGTNESSGLY